MIWIKTAFFALLVIFEMKAFASSQLKPTTLKNIKNHEVQIQPKTVTVVQFWASWCTSCGETMQKLNRVTSKSKTKLYGVSLDEELNAVSKYIAAKPFMKKFQKKILWDPEAAFAENLKVQAVPTIIVFDTKGKEVYRKEGKPEAKDIAELKKAIKGAKS
jgi:thiol-disulfide isomerase/thioredoxin